MKRIIVLLSVVVISVFFSSSAHARFFSPETGRYLTPDPIGLAGGINPFVYASNNPLSRIDPWGLADLNLFKPGTPILSDQTDGWNPPDYYSVSGHGTPIYMVGPNGNVITPSDLAKMIMNDQSRFHGQPVYLDACSTGRDSSPFAQQLADILGVPVTAPTENVTVMDFIFFYGRSINNGGIDKTFIPRRPRPF